MKKIIVYFLTATMLFSIPSLSDPEKVQAAERSSISSTVAKVDPLTGIRKIKSGKVRAVILGDSIAVSQGASIL